QPPDKVSLIRWLERAVEQGLVSKDGRGLRNHPFRYWLPEREAVWRQDPLACLHMPELFDPQAFRPRPPCACPGFPTRTVPRRRNDRCRIWHGDQDSAPARRSESVPQRGRDSSKSRVASPLWNRLSALLSDRPGAPLGAAVRLDPPQRR